MSNRKLFIIVGIVVALGVVWAGSNYFGNENSGRYIPPDQRVAPPGQVWSEEHGHYHDAPPGTRAQVPVTAPPPGQAPPGKVWNQEHVHYHDVPPGTQTQIPATATTPPADTTLSE